MNRIRQILISLILSGLVLTLHAQTYELHNSINFSNVNDGRDIPDGITWYKPRPLSYGIYRTNGAWIPPNYQQLQLAYETGIVIDGGSVYAKSGTILQPNLGNVGIGVSVPQYKLHTVSTNNIWAAKIENQGCAVYFAYGNGTSGGYGAHIRVDNNRNDRYALEIYDGTRDLLYVRNDGNIGIGTGSPEYKLDVNGTIRAKEIKVETGWADFVFAPTYKLRPLSEVEQFIKTNGHLPEIPKAEEVQQNGVNLGEMQTKLLQKVEELTLYSIELKKENIEQTKENAELKQKLADYGKEMKELKNLLMEKLK